MRPAPAPAGSSLASRRTVLLAGLIIALGALAAYHNSFSVPFIFDDSDSILTNPTIRHGWRTWAVLAPPSAGGETVGGRPVLNLSLAVNYAIGGTDRWSYHVLNLEIHILAGLVLFGIVRRTFLRWSALSPTRLPADGAAQRVGDNALHPTIAAFFVALLWTLHPLQTESVTYVVQRAESLMGLFYLLTLYCFIRYVEPSSFATASADKSHQGAGHGAWAVLSVLACLLGMGSKEVMVSAPVMVLLYDRTFVSGSFAQAWRRRWRLYLGLASTWILLAYLVQSTHRRGDSAGFGLAVAWWDYALTQFPAVVRYLGLSVWPHPLIFDYGAEWVAHPWSVAPAVAVVVLLLGGTIVAFWRWPALGFLGAWFFAILAPTSIVPGNRQTLAEHRMYLALAPVIVLGVWGLWSWLGRRASIVALSLAAILLGALTVRRNADYRTDLALWSDTVAKRPGNPYAQTNLGVDLVRAGDTAGGVARYEEALRLRPTLPEANNNLGNILRDEGRIPEAIAHYETALRARPDYADVYSDLGIALVDAGRLPEALDAFARAIHFKPDLPEARSNYGNALRLAGRMGEAEAQLREAVRLQPDYPNAELNLGLTLVATGRLPEAVAADQEAVRLTPRSSDAHYHLGNALAQMGRLPEALAEFQEAVRLDPGNADAQDHLDQARRDLGR